MLTRTFTLGCNRELIRSADGDSQSTHQTLGHMISHHFSAPRPPTPGTQCRPDGKFGPGRTEHHRHDVCRPTPLCSPTLLLPQPNSRGEPGRGTVSRVSFSPASWLAGALADVLALGRLRISAQPPMRRRGGEPPQGSVLVSSHSPASEPPSPTRTASTLASL